MDSVSTAISFVCSSVPSTGMKYETKLNRESFFLYEAYVVKKAGWWTMIETFVTAVTKGVQKLEYWISDPFAHQLVVVKLRIDILICYKSTHCTVLFWLDSVG